ncbi:sensor histidine kinase [Massilia sp. CFBP9026]|uniref:sensor histidine kinase n=1 Tax=Massilia sp. CFBP9026 TaxID=3096536 RepID=UPI002A6AF389|nr:histidine kinase [Massilia sp. CFBP9026]MDY0962375.1 histidine kinase [Massilia sp. CFBP9026]
MNTATPTLARRRGHPLELFPVFRRWPRSAMRDLLYTALWNTLIALAITVVLQTFGNWPSSFHTMFGYSLLASQCIGFPIHGALRLLEIVVPPTASRLVARLLELAAIALCAAFGLVLSGAILRGALPAMHSDAFTGLLALGLVIGVAMLAVLVAGERRIERQTLEARRHEQMATAARLLAEAQLRALQAQIEPHFLYNTLANVVSLIDGQPIDAKRMLERFIDYLRASLAASRAGSATLGAELDLAASYLDVLGVRMGARLRWRIEADEASRALPIAPMLVQPLVENAVMHGLEPKVDGGEIVLRAAVDEGVLRVEVRDSGRGLVAAPPRPGGGVGLSNLRERVRQLHGPGARLELLDNPGGGVVARLLLPFSQTEVTSSTAALP